MLASHLPLLMEASHLGCEGMGATPDLGDRLGSPTDMVHLLTPTLSEAEKTDLQSDLSLDFDSACPESSKFDPDSVLGASYLERASDQGAMSDCLTGDSALDLPVSVGSFENSLPDFDVNPHHLDGQLVGMGADMEDCLPAQPPHPAPPTSSCQPGPTRPVPLPPTSASTLPSHSTHPIKLQLVNTSPVVIGNMQASNFVNSVLANKTVSPMGGGMIVPSPTVAMVPGFIILSPLSNFVNLVKPMSPQPPTSVSCRGNLVIPSASVISSFAPARAAACIDDFVITSKPGSYLEELPDPLPGEESSPGTDNSDMGLDNSLSPVSFTSTHSQSSVDKSNPVQCQFSVPSVISETTSVCLDASVKAAVGSNVSQQASKPAAAAACAVTEASPESDGREAERGDMGNKPMDGEPTPPSEMRKAIRARKHDFKPRKKRGPRQSRKKAMDADQGRTFEVFIKTTLGAEEVVSVGEDSRGSATSEDVAPAIVPAEVGQAPVPVPVPVPMPGPATKAGDGRPFKCNLCSASFSKLGGYTRHRMIHNVRTESDFRYKCDICERTFLQRCDMKRHKLIHLQQEPYRCDVCGKGYIRRSDLIVHKRFHEKNKAYKCEQCDKRFYQTGDLNRHMRQVHLKCPTLTCGHCHRKYAKEATLLRHMQAQHRDIILTSISNTTSSSKLEKNSKPEEKSEKQPEELIS